MLEITNQLFTQIRKDPNSDRYYLDCDEIALHLDYPEPVNDDWEEWDKIDHCSLPEAVKDLWWKVVTAYARHNAPNIYSLQVNPKYDCWYLWKWDIKENSLFHLTFHKGNVWDIHGKSILRQSFLPSPPAEIRAKSEVVWQGYNPPTEKLIEAFVGAYNLGRAYQNARIQAFLQSI